MKPIIASGTATTQMLTRRYTSASSGPKYEGDEVACSAMTSRITTKPSMMTAVRREIRPTQ
jgi:hypothetical protein